MGGAHLRHPQVLLRGRIRDRRGQRLQPLRVLHQRLHRVPALRTTRVPVSTCSTVASISCRISWAACDERGDSVRASRATTANLRPASPDRGRHRLHRGQGFERARLGAQRRLASVGGRNQRIAQPLIDRRRIPPAPTASDALHYQATRP